MHVVLSGYYGFDNVGDEAILFSIVHALRKWQPDVKITVLSNNPASTAQTYGVNAVNRWKLKEVSQMLKQADGLISGGGSLMQDQTGMKSIPYYCGIIRIAKFHKKPVFVYAQGMGPINQKISQLLVKNTFKKVDQITVRDVASKQLLADIGVNSPVSIVPDPVMGLDAKAFRSEWLTQQSIDNGYITVSVRDWPSTVPFKQRIADSLDLLARDGKTIVFIPMHGDHDEKSSHELAAQMQEKCIVAPGHISIEEKIAVIGQSDLLIGMRLHSLIFSAIQATPFIALSYDPKIDAFADIANQPVIGHVEKDDWDGTQLFERAVDMLANLPFLEQALSEQVQALQAEANATAKLALETFLK
ncbi:MAG: polysaccharide pyruvyl transferase CsaB [Solibacillus sp.]